MAFRPFPNEIGGRLFQEICSDCWAEWLKHQQALINHYALNLQDPEARKFLYTSMEDYLFGSGEQSEASADTPAAE